jgi:hypothetical protein
MLGSVIRAEVGDTVKLVFRNMASHNHTLHPHNFRYAKSSEGLSSAMQMIDGNAIPPSQTWTYTWEAPGKASSLFPVSILNGVAERSELGPLDPPGLAWTYHSDAAGTQDAFSGLVGASIIYRQGELAKHTLDVPAPSGSDVIEEVLTLFLIVDENESYYIDENSLNKTSISERELQVNRMDPGFRESNLKNTISGFMFGNLMGINLTVGTHATWHALSGQSASPEKRHG